MRKLGIDFGDKRIGLAITDVMGIIASPLETFISKGTRKDIDYIVNVISSKQVDTIVLGLPYNLDGTEGKRAKKTRFFGDTLSKVAKIPVHYKDERLTSVEAEEILNIQKVSRKKVKQVIDQVSAQIILQSYIDTIIK